MEQLTTRDAVQLLEHWLTIVQDRDRRVVLAVDAGISKLAIARIMKLSPNTVHAILRKHREQASE